MNGSKSKFESGTLGFATVGFIMALIGLLKLSGIDNIFGVNIDLDEGQVTEMVWAVSLLITYAGAFYKRITATKVLK